MAFNVDASVGGDNPVHYLQVYKYKINADDGPELLGRNNWAAGLSGHHLQGLAKDVLLCISTYLGTYIPT